MVMPQHILNDAMLQEYLSSPRRDRTILNHVKHCSECQAMVRKGRLLRLLLHKPSQSPVGEHISSHDLAAFAEEKLNEWDTQKTMQHLAECEQCLAAYAELDAMLAAPRPKPTSAQRKIALAAFVAEDEPSKAISLGTLMLQNLGKGYAFFFKGPPDLLTSEAALFSDLDLDGGAEQSSLLSFDLDMSEVLDDLTDPSFDAKPNEEASRSFEYDEPPIKKPTPKSPPRVAASVGSRISGYTPGKPPARMLKEHIAFNGGAINLEARSLKGTVELKLDVEATGTKQPFTLIMVRPDTDHTQQAWAGEQLDISVTKDLLALRFEGGPFAEPVEITVAPFKK